MGNVCNKLLQLDTAILRRLTCCKIMVRYSDLEKRWAIELFFMGMEGCNHTVLLPIITRFKKYRIIPVLNIYPYIYLDIA